MSSAPAPEAPEELGMGYDRVQRGKLEYCAVAGKSKRTELAENNCHFRVCETAQEVATALNIDTSVSVSYLSVASASVKSQFIESLKLTTRSVTIVVYAYRESAKWTLTGAKLSDDTTKPDSEDGLADFVAAYGDSHISEVVQGAEYFAAYAFHMETSEQQKSFALQAKAAVKAASVEVAAEVQTKLSNLASSSMMETSFDQKISGVAEKTPDPTRIVEFAQSFPTLKIVAPKTLRFKVAGYEGIPGLRAPLAAMVRGRDHFLGTAQRPGLYGLVSQLKGLKNQADRIKGIYDCYNFEGDTALEAFRKGIEEDLNALDDQVSAYAANPATSLPTLTPKSFEKGEPQLQIEPGADVQFGGNGGNPWNFTSIDEAIRKRVRIAGIRFGGDGVIQRLEIDYRSPSAAWTDRAGNGEAYQLTTNLALGDDDFIKVIVVHAGEYVDRMEVELFNGEIRKAGGTGGGRHAWLVPFGSFVLGFQGRRGKYLDRLHIVHAALKNAKFVKH
jgi:hypothetical protein